MAVIGRNSTPIVLMMLIAVWVSTQSAVAADYLYGSIAGWGNLIDPDGEYTRGTKMSPHRTEVKFRLDGPSN